MIDEYQKIETVPERIFKLIVAKIQAGELMAGDRLPGDRVLAEEYKVGRSSMISALQMLQQKGYIDRIPMQGSFIRKNVEKITSEVRIFCPLPELTMLPEQIGYANFVAENEMQQGLIADGTLLNFSVTFRHLEDSADPLNLRRQLEVIQESGDAVVFIGPQFIKLRDLIYQHNIPAVIIEPNQLFNAEKIPFVSYDREQAFSDFAQYILKNNCRTFAFISMDNPDLSAKIDLDLRMHLLEERLKSNGVDVKYYTLPYADRVSPELYRQLQSLFFLNFTTLPDAFCCPHFPVIMALQNLAAIQRWQSNGKIHIYGHTGGGLFSLAYPAVPFIRVPCFQMGKIASRMLYDRIVNGLEIKSRVINTTIWDGTICNQ